MAWPKCVGQTGAPVLDPTDVAGAGDVAWSRGISAKAGAPVLDPTERRTEASARAIERASSDPTMVTRNNVMEPATTENLDRFLGSMETTPEYLLAPAHYNSESGRTSVGFRLAIQKSGLVVRNAWEIAVGDVDVMGLLPDDDPVIPAGAENPPCKEVLAFLKSRQRS